jgi:CRP-like cAMP-binding protein
MFNRARRLADAIRSLNPAARKIGVPCELCPLRRRPAFLQKDAREVEFIQSFKVAQRTAGAGTELIQAGQEDAELLTLFSGWAFRHQTLPDGRRQILNFFLPGDLIGFQASLMSAAQHSVEALTDVEVCVFARAKAWTIFQTMPELGFQLAWLGAREEGMVDDNLTSVGQMGAKERMAALLLTLFRRAQHLGLVEERSFFFPLKHAQLSDALGLSLVHTIKTWSALRKAGLFSLEGQRLQILNPGLTAKLAAFYSRDWQKRPIL